MRRNLKRLNKLTKDEDERPVGVKLENLSDVVDAMPKPVNVRRPIVVATRRHLKVGRARKENVEQLEDDDDDDDHDHAHETPKPSTSQRTYTLHRQAKRRYRRLPTLAPGLHTEWQADLAIFDRLAKQNRGYKYLLVCIDTLSRQVFVEPIKIYTVEGVDGSGKGISLPAQYNSSSAQMTLNTFACSLHPNFMTEWPNVRIVASKERLYRYFTERNTYKTQAENVVRRQPRYRVGDRVRIEKYKHVFQKGYLPRFTNELFTVAEVHSERSPVVYRLRDDLNEVISGWFYANDLCKSLEDKQQKMYEIEKVLKKKKQKGTVEQQFVQVEWQTGNTVRIEVPPSNVTNPLELSKNLYRLLGEGSDPLVGGPEKNTLSEKTKEKRGVRDEELLLQAMLTDTATLVELNSVAHGLLAREKSAATSNVPDKNLSIIDELGMTKLKAEIKNLSEEERATLEATKEMGTEAWIQAYREIRLVCQFNYDVNKNRFVLNTDPRYVKKVEVSPQLEYILGFNNTEFMQAENEARFMPDMSGGVSSFHVYTPDLIEPMMIGDVTAPVLRIVTIRGNPDQSANVKLCVWTSCYFLFCTVGVLESFEKIVSVLHFGKQQTAHARKQLCGLRPHSLVRVCANLVDTTFIEGLPYQRGSGSWRSVQELYADICWPDWKANWLRNWTSGNGIAEIASSPMCLEGKDLKESLLSESTVPPNQCVCCSFISFRGQVLPLGNKSPQESPYLFRLYSDNLWTDLSRIYLYLELSH
ncbi:hypothetical protein niasHT_024688 [Heterodera trifolii]|uniref:Uncharacterized protein n=1 Tax=Heterodera trifolii TaxID=157864 RepID=A0ABD2K896_9BILA